MMIEKREQYEKALERIHELIVLAERQIPDGPEGVYGIIDDIDAYVSSLRCF